MIITKYTYLNKGNIIMKKSYLLSLIYVSSGFFILSLALSLFTSCSPSTTTGSSTTTTTTGSTSTPPPPTEVKCDKASDDSTGVCSERDSCADICGEIYDSAREKSECEELSIRQVGELDEVYDLLTNKVGDLEELSEEEDDYEIEHLQCYLSIGGNGWIEGIKDNDFSSNDAQDTLEWLAENNDVAAILTGDTNDGKEIVEELLLKILPAITSTDYSNLTEDQTISKTILTAATGGSSAEDLWELDRSSNAKDLNISTYDNGETEETITLDSDDDAILYDALSYRVFDSNEDNIFSLSTDESNPNLFDLAFSILNEVCEDAGRNEDESIACRKALLCWVDEHSSEDIWDMIEDIDDINGNDERQDALGGNNFKDCEAGDFADLF